MYAVIKTGAKQHKVSEGDVLSVEKLEGEKGSEVVFNEVLMVSDDKKIKIGKPFVDGAKVIGEIIAPFARVKARVAFGRFDVVFLFQLDFLSFC